MQKRVIRAISGAGYRDHTEQLFTNLQFLKFYDIHRLELLKFVYDQLRTPVVILYELCSDFHRQYLRNQNMLRPPQPRSEAAKRFVAYAGCLAWNSLPEYIRVIENKTTFKLRLKKYILNNQN